MLLTHPDQIRKVRNISTLAGIALVVCAAFGAAWSLPPERFTLAALGLGICLGLAIASRRPIRDKSRIASAVLLALAATTPLTLPLLDQAVAAIGALSGLPLLGPAIVASAATAATVALARRRAFATFPGHAAVYTSAALGLLLLPGSLLPRLSPAHIGLGALALLILPLLVRRPEQGQPVAESRPDRTADGGLRGLLIGGGVPLLLLTAGPIYGTTPGWYAQALGGLLSGFAITALARGRAAGFFRHIGPALAPLVLLACCELLLRSPVLFLKVRPLLGSIPSSGYLLSTAMTVTVFGLLALCAGRGGSRTAPAAGLGLLAWLALPPLLGSDTALRMVVGAAALLTLPAILATPRTSNRLAGAFCSLAALIALALPTSPAGPRLVAPYESFDEPARLAQLVRTMAWRGARVDAGAAGSTISSGNGEQPLIWYRGASLALGPQQRSADRLLGHLPGLLGDPPSSTLILGAGTGTVLDAARRSSAGSVRVWEPLRGLRGLIRRNGNWNRQAASDPAVRFLPADPLGATGSGPYDAILVDLPPPWWTGGTTAYGGKRLDRIGDHLSGRGVAVFRLPLAFLSADELASFVSAVCSRFAGVSAWLNPSGARNLLLVARTSEGAVDAGAAYRAWQRAAVREDLSEAAMAGPADVLERLIANRHALLQMVKGHRSRSWIGTAMVSGRRVRLGRRGLPLSALAEAVGLNDPLLDLSTVPEDELAALQQRLKRSGDIRRIYLEMLGHWAGGEASEALGLASRLARESASPARDLKAVIEPWLRRGEALRAQGLLPQARSELLMAATFSPKDIEANLKLAGVCRGLDELSEAERYYKVVLNEEPQHLEAALGLADLRQRQGRLADAVELLEQAEDSHPGSYELLVNLAFMQMQLARGTDENMNRRLSRARVLFQRAAALEPGRPEGRAGLGEVYYRMGQARRSLAELDRALLLQDSCHYRSWRGHALYALDRKDEAEREVQHALLACPELIDALVLLGNLTADQGRYDRAREAWQQVLALQPGNKAASFNLDQLGLSGVEQLQ